MHNNIHITMNSFSHGSRILRETATLMQSEIVQHVYIIALHDEGLMEYEKLDNQRTLW